RRNEKDWRKRNPDCVNYQYKQTRQWNKAHPDYSGQRRKNNPELLENMTCPGYWNKSGFVFIEAAFILTNYMCFYKLRNKTVFRFYSCFLMITSKILLRSLLE
ncbi:MAG: hypothetical protein ABH836_03125, partial [Candidatus Omnitrophota bacterium]